MASAEAPPSSFLKRFHLPPSHLTAFNNFEHIRAQLERRRGAESDKKVVSAVNKVIRTAECLNGVRGAPASGDGDGGDRHASRPSSRQQTSPIADPFLRLRELIQSIPPPDTDPQCWLSRMTTLVSQLSELRGLVETFPLEARGSRSAPPTSSASCQEEPSRRKSPPDV